MTNKDLNFTKAIAPLTPASFFKDYWEQRPLVISERPANYYTELMTLADVDRILYSLKPDWKKLRLIRQGRHFARNFMHPDGTPNIVQVYRAYEQGYSLNLLDIQERWLPLAALARDWESFLHHSVSINLYLTPQNSRAFEPHFDDHDVFILQIEGEKDWQIWEPVVKLPSKEFTGNKFLPKDDLPSPAMETHLKTGDLLYLPRGWGHAASTGDGASLHLTVGVFVYTWSDLVDSILGVINQQDLKFQNALPVGFMRDTEVRETIKEDFYQSINNFVQQAKLELGIEQLGERLIRQMKDPLPGRYFSNIEQLSRIDLKTLVTKKPGTFCQTTVKKDEIVVNYPGNQLKLPKSWENAIKNISGNRQIVIEDFPGTNDEKLTFARQMVRSGLLTIETEELTTPLGG
ncbi:MAG: hypothetical protein F6K37_14155 [Moorea sp. SIO4E2]|uniref:cupin domain-containing protein n=1 Tax=Moorena sp. SIO4E2 TaxID=2607826 RepID=UPI0013B97D6D|nr:cupin domain-containing protein [Moorena sp. SIO4E2]NEQ07038.1 hypothetical protein [Moorena sp. SIO4E2]